MLPICARNRSWVAQGAGCKECYLPPRLCSSVQCSATVARPPFLSLHQNLPHMVEIFLVFVLQIELTPCTHKGLPA